MKTLKTIQLALVTMVTMSFFIQPICAQSFTLSKSGSSIKVDGTSNIHDWTIISESFQGNLTATIENGRLVKIGNLEFTVPSESLKSGKTAMDKNTYKALDSRTHKNITYKLEKINGQDCTAAGQCTLTTSGTLTIAGTKKPVDITFDVTVSANKIIISGSKELKMTTYKVKPPTAMLGTITTGDEVEISLKATFTK